MFGKKKEKIKEIVGNHVSGLDIPNVAVSVVLSQTGLKIAAPSIKKEYNLTLERIRNISWYNEVEFEKHIKSSLLGGVIGTAAFGAAGAVIGSRPKEKEKRKVQFYLLVEYPDNKIILQSEDGFAVGSIVDYFKKLKPESSSTESIQL